MNFTVRQIGTINVKEENYSLHLLHEYLPGLKHIEGFSHLRIIWWAHLSDEPETRTRTVTKNLFRHAPDEVGVFASRTTERPNPVMISTVKVEDIDPENGIIIIPFIDAENGTPVLDIKPYFPVERIRESKTPEYYSHWPQWGEDAHRFDWKSEISFESL